MTESSKQEAIARLKLLVRQGLDRAVLTGYEKERAVFFSDRLRPDTAVHTAVLQSTVLRKAVDAAEREYQVHIYYVALQQQGLARIAAMLFVEQDPDEWAYSRSCLEQGIVCAIACDLDTKWTEAGDIRYRFIDGCLVRTV